MSTPDYMPDPEWIKRPPAPYDSQDFEERQDYPDPEGFAFPDEDESWI